MRMQGSPHTFPAIRPDTQDGGLSDDCFRPLFQNAQGNMTPQSSQPGDARNCGQENDPLAVALKESYERGVEAGNQEACGLAQKELKPALDRFFNSLNAFSDTYRQLTHDSSSHLVALALAVVGKILKGYQIRSIDKMSPVQQVLDDKLRHQHQLNLQLNIQDLKELADLMRCRNIEMNDAGAVQICDNETVQRGNPQYTNAFASFEASLEHIIQALDALPAALPSEKASTS